MHQEITVFYFPWLRAAATAVSAVSLLDVYMFLLCHTTTFCHPHREKAEKRVNFSRYSDWCIIYFSTGDWGLCPQYFSSNQHFRNYGGSLMETYFLAVVLKGNLKYFCPFFFFCDSFLVDWTSLSYWHLLFFALISVIYWARCAGKKPFSGLGIVDQRKAALAQGGEAKGHMKKAERWFLLHFAG